MAARAAAVQRRGLNGLDLALSIDLGGTELRAGLLTRAGGLVGRRQVPTDALGGPQAVVAQMARLIEALRREAGNPAVAGIGVASPGPLDPEHGVVIDAPTLGGWHDVPLVALLEAGTGLPARLENDANAAALGEWRAGAGIGLRHMIYVTVSTGIGGGVIADGRLLHGHRGMAAEIGHMTQREDGPLCSCGGLGCFEALASGTALDTAARQAVSGGSATLMRELAGAGPATARHVTAAARAGDVLALALLHEEARLLGRGFASLLHLYSPELIVVGGGVSEALDLMQPELGRAMRAAAMPSYRDVPVVRAVLGHDAGLVGAASLMWQES